MSRSAKWRTGAIVLGFVALVASLGGPVSAVPATRPDGLPELGGKYPSPLPGIGHDSPSRPGNLSFDGSQVFTGGEFIVDTRSGGVTKVAGHRGRAIDITSDFGSVLTNQTGPPDIDGRTQQLYRYDLRTGLSTLLVDNTQLDLDRLARASMSDDGRYIGYIRFTKFGINGVEILRVDSTTGQVRRFGLPTLDHSFQNMKLSDNGRYGAYVHRVFDGTSITWTVGRYDFATQTDRQVRQFVLPSGTVIPTIGLDISADGRFVVADGVVVDFWTGTEVQFLPQIWSSVDSFFQAVTSIADDGSVVAFTTLDALVANDTNGRPDAYIWTRADGQFRRISRTDRGTQLDYGARYVAISGDASTAVFSTQSSNASRDDPRPGNSLFLVRLTDDPSPDVGLVDVAARPNGGLWRLYRSGEVKSSNAPTFNNCHPIIFVGVVGPRPVLLAEESVTSMSPTPSGEGYWLFTDLGRVIPCGDAQHFGDLSALVLGGRIVDSVATPTGLGYYMVGADGGLFAFGDAVFRGSVPEVLPGVPLAGAIVAITATSTNGGYRMVASDGGMFSFGDAAFFGSVPQVLPGVRLAGDVVGMIASDRGYLVLGEDGGIFNFGESPFHGSLGGQIVPRPVAAVAVNDDLSGYVMFDSDGTAYPFGTDIDTLQ